MSTKRSLAVAAMLAMVLGLAAGGAGAGMLSTTDWVPTPGGLYQGDNTVFFPLVGSPINIVVTNVQLIPSTGAASYAPPAPGSTVIGDSFFDIFADVSLDSGATFNPMAASGPATVKITGTGLVGGIRSFDTEMLQLTISGGTLPPGVMLRESPTLASLGGHSITQVSGGYMIDSFFDVFTELSLDGGNSWIPAQGLQGPDYMHVVMTPEPATMALLGLGSLVMLVRRRRGA
jgi:hypothetical protein